MVQRIGINSDQQKKMDNIFQANRLRLVDLNATVQKDEMTLEPLMSSETPDETKILVQIDKVAQARARRAAAVETGPRPLVGAVDVLVVELFVLALHVGSLAFDEYLFYSCSGLKGVAVREQEIGPLAFFDGADEVTDAPDDGGVFGDGLDGFIVGQAEGYSLGCLVGQVA